MNTLLLRWLDQLMRTRPNSAAAHLLALACVATATMIRLAFDAFIAGVVPYATFFPAVLLATLAGGLEAGLTAWVVGGLSVWYFILTPEHDLAIPSLHEAVSLGLYSATAFIMLAVASVLRQAVMQLRESEERLRVAVNGSPMHLFHCDRNLRYTWSARGRPDWSAGRLLGFRDDEILPCEEAAPLMALKFRALAEKARVQGEVTMRTPLGRQTWEVVAEPLCDDRGDVQGLTIAGFEVTERKRAEADRERLLQELDHKRTRLEAALQEQQSLVQQKDMLFREIHHRVKNNLQLIMSLLALQSYRLDPDTQGLFEETIGRVQAMGIVHELLYQTHQIDCIDTLTYFTRLGEALGQANRTAELHIDIESLPLHIEQALPLGLIVNETVINAIKHGFPGGRTGEVSVSLRQRGADLVLTVLDNGVGLPDGFDPERGNLGMQIITRLCGQLGASFTLENQGGALFRLVLPLNVEVVVPEGVM
ncbi:MAG TPA: histidine kinase dimerization/phosphoacceptor domain -containing protein [Azospirillaceae bacterium]|nr:histidine kinase dimerization/phosphoacceptor domain -containing protein [Azospirillaceae bacterium]